MESSVLRSTKHLGKIFSTGEFAEEAVCSILEHTTQHGAIEEKTQIQKVKFYSLDAIIAVGYQVNSYQQDREYISDFDREIKRLSGSKDPNDE